MWPRVIEILLGGWLAAAPWVLSGRARGDWPVFHDVAAGVLMALLSGLCFWRPLERAHLLQIPLAFWLIGYAFVAAPPVAGQNQVLVALMLLNFAIVPTHANLPPASWRAFRPPG